MNAETRCTLTIFGILYLISAGVYSIYIIVNLWESARRVYKNDILQAQLKRKAARWSLTIIIWFPFVLLFHGLYYGTSYGYKGIRWLIDVAFWKEPQKLPDVDGERGPYR